jgi:hypothetical protein
MEDPQAPQFSQTALLDEEPTPQQQRKKHVLVPKEIPALVTILSLHYSDPSKPRGTAKRTIRELPAIIRTLNQTAIPVLLAAPAIDIASFLVQVGSRESIEHSYAVLEAIGSTPTISLANTFLTTHKPFLHYELLKGQKELGAEVFSLAGLHRQPVGLLPCSAINMYARAGLSQLNDWEYILIEDGHPYTPKLPVNKTVLRVTDGKTTAPVVRIDATLSAIMRDIVTARRSVDVGFAALYERLGELGQDGKAIGVAKIAIEDPIRYDHGELLQVFYERARKEGYAGRLEATNFTDSLRKRMAVQASDERPIRLQEYAGDDFRDRSVSSAQLEKKLAEKPFEIRPLNQQVAILLACDYANMMAFETFQSTRAAKNARYYDCINLLKEEAHLVKHIDEPFTNYSSLPPFIQERLAVFSRVPGLIQAYRDMRVTP